MKVFVYRNLHKKCFSVKCLKTKKVIAHVDSITLINAVFKVSEAGRQRVLRERQKNVHAGVVGHIADVNLICQTTRVTYNPYKFDSFVDSEGKKISQANIALIDKTGIFVV